MYEQRWGRVINAGSVLGRAPSAGGAVETPTLF